MSKYAGEAGLRQAQVEMTQARVEMFKNMKVQGILDKNVALTIIQDTTGGGTQKVLNVNK